MENFINIHETIFNWYYVTVTVRRNCDAIACFAWFREIVTMQLWFHKARDILNRCLLSRHQKGRKSTKSNQIKFSFAT